MELTLAQVVQATGATAGNIDLTTRVAGWSIDSRTVSPGDLFFAIQGENFDGHVFVETALARGAVAALVSSPVPGPVLKVPETLSALQELAHYSRLRWGGRVVGVTGSAGKTSTKDVIADLLGTRFRVGKTVGNFNNHIGLPLSIQRIPDSTELAVFELGMNHAGEIRRLSQIARPDIGVVTNVGYAHIENFESIDGVAAAKRELIEALPETGIAVLNADDARVLAFRDIHPGRTITYGFSDAADVRALPAESGFTVDGVQFQTMLPGRHSVSNILAGLAVATVVGIGLDELVDVVAALRPSKMRGERLQRDGITILNDSYNSNPEAAREMLHVLSAEPAQRRIAVLGEMLELGAMSESLHRELGRDAVRSGVDILIAVAGAGRFLVQEAVREGLKEAYFFHDPESAGTFLRERVRPGDAVLFKGSRGTHVERSLATMEG